MGVLDWMRKRTRGKGIRLSNAQQSCVPTFEQLEPRVLLSADVLLPLESTPVESPVEPAILVELDETEADQSQCDSATVEQCDNKTLVLSDSQSTGLSVSELGTVAQHIAAQLNENKTAEAGASEDLNLHTSNLTPQTSDLDFVQIRGPPTEIVFIESSLNVDLQLENAYSSGVMVSVFDADQDGIQQITHVISSYSDLSAIHIISHGSTGQVILGTSLLNLDTLETHAGSLDTWKTSLTDQADILIYGCSVGQGHEGISLLHSIAILTGADVAASDDLTGAAELGGDWHLEETTGWIEAPSLTAEFAGVLQNTVNPTTYDEFADGATIIRTETLLEEDPLSGVLEPSFLQLNGQGLEFTLTPSSGMAQQAIDGFQAAADLLSGLFSDDIRVNIRINFTTLDPGILGIASSTTQTNTYSQVVTALTSDKTTSDDDTAVANLPEGPALQVYINRTSNSPNGSGNPMPYVDNDGDNNNTVIRMTTANAKALGLRTAGNTASDASITFSDAFAWDFDRSDGIAEGAFDFVGVAAHEIGHALGFTSGVDTLDINSSSPDYFRDDEFTYITVLDLYRHSYDSIYWGGDLDWAADTRTKFFSLDGGSTKPTTFSTGQTWGDGHQASHWKDDLDIGIMDPTGAPGEYMDITDLDLTAWDVIGWDRVPVSIPEITVLGNGVSITDGDTTPSVADHTDFASVAQSSFPVSRTFTVRHDGVSILTLGSVVVPIGFTLTEPLSSSLVPGGSDTFTVRLDTAVTGVKSGNISFTTNDPDENPFNFRITGTVAESVWYDFGDAPAPYATTLTEDGARHAVRGPTLGTYRDSEADGRHSTAADADDTTGTPDDEDGVTFGTIQVGQLDASVTVNVRGGSGKLDAWIDFNRDGSWRGAGEYISMSRDVMVGDNVLTFDVPSWAISGATYARFRLSTAGQLGPGGLAGDGEVEDHLVTIASASGSGVFIDNGSRLGHSSSYGVSFGDLDGDGDLDAFVANVGANKVWLNDGSGSFADSGNSLGISNSWSVSLGDLDGDGDLDAFVVNNSGQANRAWLNNGSGVFTDSSNSVLGGDSSRGVSLGDLDGDGDLDAFVANYGKANKVWLNNGSGAFTDSGNRLGSSQSNGVSLGDLDGDGDLDAFVANKRQANKVWLNDGSGSFTDSGNSLGSSESYGVSLGDLDGDGDLDAFVAIGGANKVWLNNGSGVFADSGNSLGDYGSGVSLGDLDGDGDLDAFVTVPLAANRVWLNNGSGSFTDSGNSLGSSYSSGVSLGDLDGDGDLDAFVANGGANMVWLNQDGNEPPTDISLSASSISENRASGIAVGTLATTDPDAGDTHTYSLVSGTGSGDNSSFTISNNQLLTNAVFDYETKNSYSIRIETDDGNGDTHEEAFTITVTDVDGAWTIGPETWTTAGLTLIRDGDVLHVYQTGTTNDRVTPWGVEDATNIVITGRDSEDDALTVDFGGGNPIPAEGLVYEGGAAGNDSLNLIGGSFTDTVYHFANLNDGSIDLDGSMITYTGLEPLSAAINAVNLTLDYSDAHEMITITDAGSGQTTVDSTAGESVTFNDPAGSLTINGGAGDDTINIVSLAATYPANLTIDGQDGLDVVNVNGHVNLASDKDLSIIADTLNVAGSADISTSGSGAGAIAITVAQIELAGTVGGSGSLVLAPSMPDGSIGLGGGLGTFNLDDLELANLADGFSSITIGDANGTGTVDINTAVFMDPVTIVGGTIHDHSGIDIDAPSVTLIGNVSPGQSPGILRVSGDFAFADHDTFTVEIGGTSPGTGSSNYDQIDVAGMVTIGSNVTLNVTSWNSFSPTSGNQFTIVDNDSTDAIVGTFSGLPEGAVISDFLGSGLNGIVTYRGGDGNDLAISVNGPPTVALANTTTSLPETADTRSRIKVADIVVTDDPFGTNALTLRGDDAVLFEIDGTELYLKAGTVLDDKTHSQLDVTVEADDPTVGTTPDDTVSLSITVLDVPDIILDTGDPGTGSTGTWYTSGAAGAQGNDSLFSLTAGNAYSFSAHIAGLTNIALWWIAGGNRSSAVSVEIHDGTTLLDTIVVNQQTRGSRWNTLGTYDLAGPVEVQIIVTGGGTVTMADAVRFAESTSPEIRNLTPTDGAVEVAVTSPLVMQFNEDVLAGTGNIVIRRSDDDSIVDTIDMSSPQVSIAGDTATILPGADLDHNTSYYVQIAATVFTDRCGNAFMGIPNTTTWSFTTEVGNHIVLDTGDPGTGSTGTWYRSSAAGAQGNASLFSLNAGDTYSFGAHVAGPTDFALWWVAGGNRSSAVSVDIYDGTTLLDTVVVNQQIQGSQWNTLGTYNLTGPVEVRIIVTGGGAVTMADAVRFAERTSPEIRNLTPTDGAAEAAVTSPLVMRFNEDVLAGTGDIVIRRFDDDSIVDTINVNSPQVSITGDTVTIVPSADLDHDTSYYVQIAATAFTDRCGNAFMGMADTTTWSFTTEVGNHIVLDTGDPGTGSTGTWYRSGAAGAQGNASLFSFNAGDTYSFGAHVAGPTDIALWWVAGGNRSSAVSVEIYDGATLLDTVVVNQQIQGSQWNTLGTYNLTGPVEVRIIVTGGGAVTMADAVRFAERTSPEIRNLTPTDGAAEVDVTSSLVIEFNEDVLVGTGDIVIHRTDDDTVVDTIDVTSLQVSVTGDTVTIAPSADLSEDTGYYVQIAGTAFTDRCGNAFTGMTNTTTWSFVTEEGNYLVLDTGDPGTGSTGTWYTSGAAGAQGNASLFSLKAGDVYRFSADVAGPAEIALWWIAGGNRSAAVSVEIYDGTILVDTVVVNQQIHGSQWNSLGVYSFTGTAEVRIISTGGGSVTIADAIRLKEVPAPPDIILDTDDPGTGSTGTWRRSGAAGAQGNDALYSLKVGDTYSFSTHVSDRREVSLWWTAGGNRSSAVLVEIYDGTTLLDTVVVNQQIQGSQWNSVGVYNFAGTAEVRIISTGSGAVTIADAIRLEEVPAPPDIVLDTDDPGTGSTGTWNASSAAGAQGNDSLYSLNAGDTYSFSTHVSDLREISLWWIAGSNRSTAVSVEIYDGTTLLDTVVVNQQLDGSQWHKLGAYAFTGTAEIRILATGGGLVTVADAVRLMK